MTPPTMGHFNDVKLSRTIGHSRFLVAANGKMK